jgi:hypothetical protein
MRALDAALAYASRGWSVFPCRPWPDKQPLTEHGFKDATRDPEQIQHWWKSWPRAAIGIATGQASKVVVFDVDAKHDGLVTLEVLGLTVLPPTPISHTGGGGFHVLFDPGDRLFPCSKGEIGVGIDVRGDGGYALIPPSAGYSWDAHYGLKTPLAPAPRWLVPAPATRQNLPIFLARPTNLSRYAEAALSDACRCIVEAKDGTQESTMGRQAYGIGRLVGAGLLARDYAEQELLTAARKIPEYDPRHPWTTKQIERRIRTSLNAGRAHPREIRR